MSESDIDTLKSEMNKKGARREPFFFAVNYNKTRGVVMGIDELESSGISVDFEGRHFGLKISDIEKREFRFDFIPPDFETYENAFSVVMKNLREGNSYLTNLTFQHELETDLSLKEIFVRSNARFKLLFQDRFTVFSPEPFLRTEGGKIYTYPMKGTINAAIDDAASVLLKDEKEAAEHATIVDLLRNDLNIVARKIRVESYRYLERLEIGDKALLQASSRISGELSDDFFEFMGEYLFSLLPAGSVTGAPKKATLEIIAAAENYERGYYTGVFGLFDGTNMTAAVMIRYIENENGKLYYKSGGGITAYSDPKKEYEELLQKIYVPIY